MKKVEEKRRARVGESEASGDGGNGDGSESRAKEAKEASEPKSKDGDLDAELSEIMKKVWMDKTKEPKEAPIKKVATTGAKGPNVTLLEMLEIDCLEPTPRAGRPKLPPGEKERRRVEKRVAMKKALLEQRAKEATSSTVEKRVLYQKALLEKRGKEVAWGKVQCNEV